MKDISLTSREFLSLYTGVLMGDDFEIVRSAIEKVYGIDPFNMDNEIENPEELTVKLQNNFREYINEHNKELVEIMNTIGEFKSNDQENVIEEINQYVNNFEELNKSDEIEISVPEFDKEVEEMLNNAKEINKQDEKLTEENVEEKSIKQNNAKTKDKKQKQTSQEEKEMSL